MMNRILLILFLITMPFYIFKSGLPQFSSIFLLIFILLNLSNVVNTFRYKITYTYFILFLYISIVNIIYFYITQNTSFLITSLYYVFNFLVMAALFTVIMKYKHILRYILYGSIISITMQFLLSFFVSGSYHENRSTIFFNNPNQLAAYALSIVAIALICNKLNNGNKLIDLYVLSLGLYLTILSASKAGVASILAIFILYFILTNFSKMIKIISYSLSLLISIITFMIFTDNKFLYGHLPQLDFVMRRFNHNENHSEGILVDRGYTRIFENLDYIILGAGEGFYTRFGTTMELHSIYGTLLFSYGIIGLLLFLSLLIFILIKTPLRINYVLLAPLLYGITHQGLRLTMFWMIIIILLSTIRAKKECIN